MEVSRDKDWRTREAQRFFYGALKPVWYYETFWERNSNIWHEHFPFISENNRALLCYTQDRDKGERNIQTPIKPGRYLTKYFSKVLTPKQIAEYSYWQTTGCRTSAYAKLELKFATTPDDIAEVYIAGPDSCMSKDSFDDVDEPHPCRVYGAGDLAIAYLRRDDRVVARTLTWPARLTYSRVYPTESNWHADPDLYESATDAADARLALSNKLEALGYRAHRRKDDANFNGARLLKLPTDDSEFYMPYLDKDYNVVDAGEFFKMSSEEGTPATSTDGRFCPSGRSRVRCVGCGRLVDVDRDAINTAETGWSPSRHCSFGTVEVCSNCLDGECFICAATEIRYLGTPTVLHDGTKVCEDWANANCYRCYSTREFWRSAEHPPVMIKGETWSPAAAWAAAAEIASATAGTP